MCCRSPTPHCTRHPLLAAHTLAPCHAPPLLHTAHISPLVTHSSAPRHTPSHPSSRTLPSLVTQSPTPRHALSHPSSRTLPSLVTQSPTPRHALSLSLSNTYNYTITMPPQPQILTTESTPFCKTAHFTARNGPFRNTIRPILEREMTRFATHCLSAQYANAQQTQEQEHQILSRKICVFTQIFLPLQSQTYPKRLSRTCSSVG